MQKYEKKFDLQQKKYVNFATIKTPICTFTNLLIC